MSAWLDILAGTPFCDLTVFRTLLDRIPQGSDVHLANSTAARYVQLFERRRGLRFFGNRGTSGIDGCTSTAVGAAFGGDAPEDTPDSDDDAQEAAGA